MAKRAHYGRWPARGKWVAETRPSVVDPRIRKDAEGYRAIKPVEAGQNILSEYPLAYTNFSSLGNLPPIIDESSSIVRAAYDLLRRKVGGMGLLSFIIGAENGKIPNADIKLVVTDADRKAIRWMLARFRGLNRKILIVFLKAIDGRSVWNVSPVIRLVMGMGFYEGLATLQHSCEPNARLNIDLDGGRVHLMSLRRLDPGERVTVSVDEDVKWRATRENRWKILGLKGKACACARCQEGRDYDLILAKSMRKDQERIPGFLRRGNLENILDQLDSHLGLGKFSIFAIGEVWNHIGAEDAVSPLIRIRFGRSYVTAMLQMTAEDRKLLDQGEEPAGVLGGMEEHEGNAKVEPERIADVYGRSIAELERLRYLGRPQLTEDRVRLKLFRAFLLMRHLDVEKGERPMLSRCIEFLVTYSAAMCMAEREWGSIQPLIVEAEAWSEPMRAVMGLGEFIVNSISSGNIQA